MLEFGCGDGGQLQLADYPRYTGLDVSQTAIELCSARFRNDPTKSFELYDPLRYDSSAAGADLVLSLDVVYHLVEDEVFERHMTHVFDSASRFVIIYSSNGEIREPAAHVRHRRFTDWIQRDRPQWIMDRHVAGPFPWDPDDPLHTSPSDFFVFVPRKDASLQVKGLR